MAVPPTPSKGGEQVDGELLLASAVGVIAAIVAVDIGASSPFLIGAFRRPLGSLPAGAHDCAYAYASSLGRHEGTAAQASFIPEIASAASALPYLGGEGQLRQGGHSPPEDDRRWPANLALGRRRPLPDAAKVKGPRHVAVFWILARGRGDGRAHH